MISTLDLGTIVPMGKYVDIKIERNRKTPNGMIGGVFIYGTDTKTSVEEMIGYFGVNGIKFWAD